MIRSAVRAALACVALVFTAPALAQEAQPAPSEANIVYGMVSGAAMLLDVYRPDTPNGLGVVAIPGSGWHAPRAYDAPALKDLRSDYIRAVVAGLAERGFTVFVINHRAAPEFPWPAAVEDAQRAVRFVRANAERFGIDPDRIGALGHSSGGNLAALTGVLDDAPGPGLGPIDAVSARVQAVVTLAAPFDLTVEEGGTVYGAQVVTDYLGEPWFGPEARGLRSTPPHVAASPAFHVDAGDAPFYIAYSPDDPVVPVDQALRMIAALRAAGAEPVIAVTDGVEHDPAVNLDAIARWLEAMPGAGTARAR